MKLDVGHGAHVEDTLNLSRGSASTGAGTTTDPAAAPAAPVSGAAAEEPAVPGGLDPRASEDHPDAEPPETAEAVEAPDAAATNEAAGTDEAADTPEAVEPAALEHQPIARAPRQTLAGRVWIGLIAAVVLLVLLIIFVAENTKSVSINFLGAHGHIALGLALLIAIVIGIAITLTVGSARIVQLSLEVRRHRRKLNQLS